MSAARRLLLLLYVFTLPAQAGERLLGAYATNAPQSAEEALQASTEWSDFDTGRRLRFQRNPDGAWLRLLPADGTWPDEAQVLALPTPPLGPVQLHIVATQAVIERSTFDLPGATPAAHGRLAFLLPANLPDNSPLLIHLPPYRSVATPLAFELLTEGEYQAQNSLWLAFASACFAVMLSMASIALLFAYRLRDATFILYAGYVCSYLLIQVVQTGFGADPVGIDASGDQWLTFGRLTSAVSVALAIIFLDRFASLASFTPSGRRILQVLAVLITISYLLGLPDIQWMREIARAIGNPLLSIGALLTLVVAWQAWRRGARYAGFFVLGWSPLLLLTVLSGLQVGGAFPDWPSLNNACLAAAAFEALVLSLGLADRAVVLRRDRDIAINLAVRDPLTGLLNRRGWTELATRAIDQAQAEDLPAALVFIDIDRFKAINDQYGHSAGDRALTDLAELLKADTGARGLSCRYGGEEFVVILPGQDLSTAIQRANHWRERFAAVTRGRFGDEGLTLSAGVATLTDQDNLERLLGRADAAMYRAKTEGRNRVLSAPAPTSSAR